MFLLQTTPNTVNYMIAGYVVILSVIAIYLVSLYMRQRNLKRDLELLEDLQLQE